MHNCYRIARTASIYQVSPVVGLRSRNSVGITSLFGPPPPLVITFNTMLILRRATRTVRFFHVFGREDGYGQTKFSTLSCRAYLVNLLAKGHFLKRGGEPHKSSEDPAILNPFGQNSLIIELFSSRHDSTYRRVALFAIKNAEIFEIKSN